MIKKSRRYFLGLVPYLSILISPAFLLKSGNVNAFGTSKKKFGATGHPKCFLSIGALCPMQMGPQKKYSGPQAPKWVALIHI